MKTRRDFIKAGLALGAALPLSDFNRLSAATSPAGLAGPHPASPKPSVLVAVRNGDRVAMLERAIAELGGMGSFVRPGQTVVIKPNFSFDKPPEYGANTHPDIVRRLVTLSQEAGARSVSIFDHPLGPWRSIRKVSGAEQIVRETGAELVNGDDETLYREVSIPRGVRLHSAKVHRLAIESDVFINAPVLKHHGGTLMTAAMKNLMGVVWDRAFYHRHDLHQCVADFATWLKPTLNVIDAYHPMVRHGPRGVSPADLVTMRMLLASTDIVAVDAAAARLLGHQPAEIRYIKIAAEMGLGTMDLDRVDIRRLSLA